MHQRAARLLKRPPIVEMKCVTGSVWRANLRPPPMLTTLKFGSAAAGARTEARRCERALEGVGMADGLHEEAPMRLQERSENRRGEAAAPLVSPSWRT